MAPRGGLYGLFELARGKCYVSGMRVTLHLKDVGTETELRPLLDHATEKLKRHLVTVSDDLLDLHVHLEKLRGLVEASLTLHVPSLTLNAKARGPAPGPCLKEAVAELIDQVHRLKSRWKGEHLRKREGERFRGEGALAGELARNEDRDEEWCREAVRRSMGRLTAFVHGEVQAHQANGDLRPGDVATEDVADAVALAALKGFRQRPRDIPFEHWLFRLAFEQLMEEMDVLRARRGREGASLEAREPEPRPVLEGPSTTEEIWEDVLPHDMVSIKDLLPADKAEPADEAAERSDLWRHVLRRAAGLPPGPRQAFTLTAVHGFTPEQAAHVLAVTPETVRRDLETARTALRQAME
jgi:RNA polymerase sigma factor (sigma-70 family)